ncbi:MAG: phosphatase PAP2 family protein [Pyrinomonadaceae bacterium]
MFKSSAMTAFVSVLLFAGSHFSVLGQDTAPAASPTPATSTTNAKPARNISPEKHFIKNIIHDQTSIWTSPFRLNAKDYKWMVPFGLGTAALIVTDRHTSAWVDRNGGLPVVSKDVSWAGKAYVTGGVAGAFYLAGLATHDQRARETGVLAAEALIDTGIVTQVLKFATQRPRPNADNGHGRFFTTGNAFPSGHASTVWSVATVIAYEYHDHPFIRYGAYAGAIAVSMSRYSGRNHFLSDIVVGSAIGFGVGRFVYRKHHVKEIDDPDAVPTRTTTKLMPTIVPYYDRRRRTYGGSLAWTF